MNRREAKARSQASEISIGDLRHLIANARGRGGMSRVNPTFTLERACEIYSRALEGRDDAEVPKGLKPDVYSAKGRMVPTRDSLTIQNILRDCA
jgi:hypothetical protein